MAATGAKGRTMRQRLEEPGRRSREDARGGVPSCTVEPGDRRYPGKSRLIREWSTDLVDERPFEQHRQTQERRPSGECRLRFPLGASHRQMQEP
jgi:hypothetical protein